MRIIPNDTLPVTMDDCKEGFHSAYYMDDTIDITDNEWDEIAYEWQDDCCVDGLCASHGVKKQYIPFSQYLKELLELKRCV